MQKPFVIGIGGGTGSGKSVVSQIILKNYPPENCVSLDQESYYLDHSEIGVSRRAVLNYDHPSALDHDLLHDQLEALRSGNHIRKPSYCFVTHTRKTQSVFREPGTVIVVEGIYALWDIRVRQRMDIRVYVDAAAFSG